MGCGVSAEQAKAAGEKAKEAKAQHDGTAVPADFPVKGAERKLYENWDGSTMANHVLMVSPKNEEEIIQVVNWAAEKGWTVRPVGIKHNWSPITVVNQGPDKSLDKVVLVSLMEHMKKVTVTPADGDKPPAATVELGCSQGEFLDKLEKAPGGNGNIGFGLIHTPAPHTITIGGMLAIDGHGTSVPCAEEDAHIDRKIASYGTYSNLMLACRAVVWDDAKKQYTIKEFRREKGDEIAPFLAHVGRAFLTTATLQVVPNYYQRCISRMDIGWETMFPKTPADGKPQEDSMAYFMHKHGRAEAIWFPFTEDPWLKIWQVTDDKCPEGSRKVDETCNYPFSDELGDNITKFYRSLVGADEDEKDDLVRQIREEEQDRLNAKNGVRERSLGARALTWVDNIATEVADEAAEVVGGPKATGLVNKLVALRIATGLVCTDSDDIWGPSKNTLLYVKDSTLRVTANGYAITTTMDHVQECMHEFAHMYHGMLMSYKSKDKYPIACPLEIRVTGIDDPAVIGGPEMDAQTPPLSATSYDDVCKERKWTVALWLDVLSLPGAEHSNEFYNEMETRMMESATFNGDKARLRPEWSKGWGYDKTKGAWQSKVFRDHTRKSMPRWNEMMDEYARHDPKNLFSNPWMDEFFTKMP